MFDLDRQVRLKQGKNALRDGRLDEAFAIATEKEIRDLRGGQLLLEELVEPLLKRAARHLAEGRLEEALLDAERAIAAGGNQPRAAEVRRQVERAVAERERRRLEGDAVMASVQGHLEKASLESGKERLKDAPADLPGLTHLRREIEKRERRGEEARERAERHLGRGEILEALAAAAAAVRAAGGEELGDLLPRLKEAAAARIETCLAEGGLESAGELQERLRACAGDSLESRRFKEAVALAEKAAEALGGADYEGARVVLGRLQKILPQAAWVGESLEALDRLAAALRLLKTGPLGALSSAHARNRAVSAAAAETLAAPRRQGEAAGRPPAPRSRERLLLWIDGAGTYLVLTANRVSLGRAGSSARPDIGLAADIAGYHAEILRIEEDYFAVAGQGPLAVGGGSVQRKLLADGETLDLGARCRLTFRLPTSLSATAVLKLHGGQRLERDVREVVLAAEHFLIGSGANCHVQTQGRGEPVVLSLRQGDIFCRAKEEIHVGGEARGREARVPLGAAVEIGDLTFTITSLGA